MTTPLGRFVEINPAVDDFDANPAAEVTFMPLEAVWADGQADLSRRATASSVSTGYTRFRQGDILLPKVTPTFSAGRVFSISMDTAFGAGTTELHVLRSGPDADPRFIAYVCRSQPFLQEGKTTQQGVGGLQRIPIDWLAKYPVHVEDLREQRSIADFLDRETARIDALIEAQERLIELLRERRCAVIADATGWGQTRRASWPLKRLSWVFNETGSGTTPANEDITYSDAAEVPWVTTGELREQRISKTARGVSWTTVERYPALKIFPAGSLLIAMYGATIGRLGILDVPAASNQACCAFWSP